MSLKDLEEMDDERHAPSALRVAQRACVLSVVTCRGFVEQKASDAGDFWSRVLQWFDGLSVSSEAEPFELQLIHSPLGALPHKDQVYATWRAEGLAVLAWALQSYALPAYDEQVVAAEVANSLGFLEPETVLNAPSLRPDSEVQRLSESMFSAHWRLAEQNLSPRQMDFESFAQTAWFGPLSLEGLRIVGADLAVGAVPI